MSEDIKTSENISKKNKIFNFANKKKENLKENGKKFMQKKNAKKIILIAMVLILAVAVALFFAFRGEKTSTKGENTGVVTRGDVTKIIEGSGTIEAIDQYEVTSVGIKGEILECTFEEGDEVKKDQVLYVIDSSDMESSINRAMLSVEKAQTSYDDALKNYNDANRDMNVTAPVSGVITALNVEDGSKVNNGANVATIKDSSNMKLSITFNEGEAELLTVGDKAEVSLENSYTTVTGTVTHVGTGTSISDDGVAVKMVEITVENPGAIKDGDKATAIVGNIACNSSGTFKSSEEKTVTAKLSGDIYDLNYKLGDYIEKGDVLFRIDYENSYSNVKNAKNNLLDAQENLDNLYEEIADYSIKAPIDGKIVQKNYKAGEKINNSSNSSSPLAIISDLSILTFDINIDELDIASIKVGQEVSITADAYEKESFSGVVDKISVVGTSSNGVTTYPVTVIVNSENKDLLIPGMNVSASIVIEKSENVLRIPVSALRRGNVVIAKTTSEGVTPSMGGARPNKNNQQGENAPNMNMPKENKSTNADLNNQSKKTSMDNKDNPFLRNLEIPEGYKAIFVEVGLSDDNFVEIKSGLNEGDIVLLPDVTTTTVTNMMGGMSGMRGMSGMGGMSGGMGAPRTGGMGNNRQSSTSARYGSR